MSAPGPIAFVRKPTEALARCELTHVERTPIDIDLALKQHGAYVAALTELGARIEWLPPLPDRPDAVFVEDTALFVADLAVMAKPGAPLRRGEVGSVAQALSAHRRIRWIEAPASLDGGDVLAIGNSVFVGMSARTNAEAVTALRGIVGDRDCVVVVPSSRPTCSSPTATGSIGPYSSTCESSRPTATNPQPATRSLSAAALS